MTYLSFPGLGIEPFHIDRIAFTVFGRSVAWYGILITCGMVLAVLTAVRLAQKEGISVDDITDFAFIVILAGIVGARAYYVIFTWNKFGYLVTDGGFLHNLGKTLYNCVAIWEGGLAIYGGVLAGLLTGFLFAKKRKLSFLKIFDILAAVVLIGQVIGRWGNFINIEAYGAETALPWRMGILRYSSALTGSGEAMLVSEKYVHPTFLYESLWNLLALLIVHLGLYPRKKFDGEIFCFYLIWYGFGRMLIESLRTDSLMLGNLRVSQGVGFLSVVIGVLLLSFLIKKRKSAAAGETPYKPVYAEGGESGAASEKTPDNGSEEDRPESEEEPAENKPEEDKPEPAEEKAENGPEQTQPGNEKDGGEHGDHH